MMETIMTWFARVIGELLDTFVSGFLAMMNVDLGTLAGFFPGFITGYRMFQSIGIGLIISIATYQLFKFFGGQLTEVRDTPIRILIRAGIAGVLLWFGGYLIQMVVDLASLPYQEFVKTGATTGEVFKFIPLDDFSPKFLIKDIGAETLSASTIICLYILVVAIIGWNLIKLMIEVLERYLMVAVLAYSAPLFYPTMTSQATSSIFKKWLGMLFGQCALLSISAWMLKLIISGFTITTHSEGVAFQLLLTLALCKIAQRTDTYMQSLGIGVATTGGNLLDDVVATAAVLNKTLSNGKSGAGTGEKADKNAVLGAKQIASDLMKPQWGGGALGARKLIGGLHEGGKEIGKNFNFQRDKEMGNPIKAYMHDFEKGFKEGHKNGIFGDYLDDAKNSINNRFGEGAEQYRANKAEEFDKKGAEFEKQRQEAMDKINEQRANENAENKAKMAETNNGIANSNEEIMSNYTNNLMPEAENKLENMDERGATAQGLNDLNNNDSKEKVGGIKTDPSNPGEMVPDAKAVEEGIGFKDGKIKSLENDPQKVGNYTAQNFGALGATDQGRELAQNTFQDNPMVAEEFLKGNEQITSDMHTENGYHDEIGQSAVNNAVQGGVESVTGNKDDEIQNFTATTDNTGARHVQFETKASENSPARAFDMYSGKQQSATDTSIKTASGETWWVNKKNITTESFSPNVPPASAGNNQMTHGIQNHHSHNIGNTHNVGSALGKSE